MATRRERIRQGMGIGGGTAVPPRRKQIRQALEGAGNGARHPIAITSPGSGGTPVRPPSPRANASLRAPVPLGKQLAGRVQSGAIDRSQALKTARQRQTLKKAFGSDWRSKVYAGSGVKEIRQGGPFANPQIRAERSKGLERAKRKLS